MSIKTQENTNEFAVTINFESGSFILENGNIDLLYFVEDIFSSSMAGKMIFRDDKGILEFGPFTGNETITLIYGQENNIERTFNILKMPKVIQHSSTDNCSISQIELTFVDPMFFILTNFQFSKSWKNKKISEIIEDIANNFLLVKKWDKKEESRETLEYFYIPYIWKLNTALSWLLKRASGSESLQPGYCFYNSSKGVNLVTLEKLLTETKIMKISDDDDGLYIFEDSNPYYFNRIQNWKLSSITNNSLDILSGGQRLGYNSQEKKLIRNEYNYSDMINNHTILGSKTLFPDISDYRMRYINFGESDSSIIDNIYINSWVKEYVRQQMFSIICRGHEERYCGGMIHINWPSNDESNKYNKGFSGKYLIKSITHSFSGIRPQHYTQNMTLIKNGYESLDFKELLKSTKKNLG